MKQLPGMLAAWMADEKLLYGVLYHDETLAIRNQEIKASWVVA